jgi:hypothetical protein
MGGNDITGSKRGKRAAGAMLTLKKAIYVGKQIYLLKNGVFCDVTACGSCKNRRFGGT